MPRRFLGVPVALVTDPSSPGLGSRGFGQDPPSLAGPEPLIPLPPTLRQIWSEFLCEFLQVSNFPAQVVDLKARPLTTCKAGLIQEPSIPHLTFLLPTFRRDPDLRTCNSQAKAQRYVVSPIVAPPNSHPIPLLTPSVPSHLSPTLLHSLIFTLTLPLLHFSLPSSFCLFFSSFLSSHPLVLHPQVPFSSC